MAAVEVLVPERPDHRAQQRQDCVEEAAAVVVLPSVHWLRQKHQHKEELVKALKLHHVVAVAVPPPCSVRKDLDLVDWRPEVAMPRVQSSKGRV